MKGVVRYFHSTEYIRLPAGRLRLNGLADNHIEYESHGTPIGVHALQRVREASQLTHGVAGSPAISCFQDVLPVKKVLLRHTVLVSLVIAKHCISLSAAPTMLVSHNVITAQWHEGNQQCSC